MKITVREINKTDPEELALVTRRCMATVLETVPEFEAREDLAQQALGNFSFQQMSNMIQEDFSNPSKRIMVATVDASIIGHAIYSVKHDTDGNLYGFCFSRYVLPEYRRLGAATALLSDAIEWFKKNGAMYVIAHTHVTNVSLKNLFTKFGFSTSGPFDGPTKYFLLRKDL